MALKNLSEPNVGAFAAITQNSFVINSNYSILSFILVRTVSSDVFLRYRFESLMFIVYVESLHAPQVNDIAFIGPRILIASITCSPLDSF